MRLEPTMKLESMTAMKLAVGKARRLCFFGIGALLAECYDQLVLALGREPDIFCDNAANKWGKDFFGKRCVSPEELSGQRDGTVVIITVRQFEAISEQLRGLGIGEIFSARYDSGYHSLRAIIPAEDDVQACREEKPVMIDPRGRWTLVTGASRGIGRQIALAMARLGSNIIAHSRSLEHCKELIANCQDHGVEIVPIAAELANLDEVEAMLASLEQCAPQVDILFNNAAIASPVPWSADMWSISKNFYRDCFIVNAVSPGLICQKLIPPMIERGFGRVVNIHTNLRHLQQEIPYICSKASLDMYVAEMAPLLDGTGVMMSLADPGWVRTDAGGPIAPNAVESVVPGILLGALLDADINGCRFSAQEYAGMTLEEAVVRVKRRLRQQPCNWV